MASLPSSRTGGRSQAGDCLFSSFGQGSPDLQQVVGSADELPFRRTRRNSSPHEPGRSLDGLDLAEDSLHHGASPFQDLPGPISVHLLLGRRGGLFLRFGPIFSLSSPGLPEGIDEELRLSRLDFRDRRFVPVSGIGHDLTGSFVNPRRLQGLPGRFQHGKPLILVVGLLSDLGLHDDLVFSHYNLGIVRLHRSFLAAPHDPALRIGRVGLEGFGIDRGLLLGLSAAKRTGGFFPPSPLFGLFFLLPPKPLGLGLQIGQTFPDPALPLGLLGQSLWKTVSVFLSRPVFLPVRHLRFGQSGLLAEQKDLGKKVFQRRSMLLPEPGDRGVVREKLGRHHPVGDIPHAQPLDLPARPLSLAVSR